MPSFRSADTQVKRALSRRMALGTPKRAAGGKIVSHGWRETVQSDLTTLAKVVRELHGVDVIQRATPEQLADAVRHQAKHVRDGQLRNYRQAISSGLGIKIPAIRSEIPTERGGRAYTRAQIEAIVAAETNQGHRLATEIAWRCGLRGAELHTLRLAHERPKTDRRAWSADRFLGRDGVRYTVVGKGHLVREIMMPRDLHERLAPRRLAAPVTKTDRTRRHESVYDLPGGRVWAERFSATAREVLGWSHGAHGLRHSYAQARMCQIQRLGKTFGEALRIVSQELGHFRPSVTLEYLRGGKGGR
jgi:site-specific recombinase XerC